MFSCTGRHSTLLLRLSVLTSAKWRETNSKTSFMTTLHISGIDEIGIVNEITHIIAKDVGVPMRSININSDKGKFEGILKVMVYNVEHIEFLMQRLRKVKGVVSVTRGEE